MSLTFDTELASVSPEVRAPFESDAKAIFSGYAALCSEFDVPIAAVQMILSDDLEQTIRQRTGSTTYEARRDTVEVAAKCLYNERTLGTQDLSVVVASAPWQAPAESGARIVGAFVLAHELMHPLLDQLWQRSGIATERSQMADTLEDAAVSLFDEYWADRLAFLVLQGLNVHVTVPLSDGTTVNLQPDKILAEFHVSSLKTSLEWAHSLWPDTVQSYREGQIDLDTMLDRVARSVGNCMILITHAQSQLDAAQDEGEAFRSIFDLEAIRDLRAVQLYVGRPWAAFWQCLKDGPIGQDADTVQQYHTKLIAACKTMFDQVWKSLGVEREPRPEGLYCHVGEPLR